MKLIDTVLGTIYGRLVTRRYIWIPKERIEWINEPQLAG
jgi:hypothetical protein